MSAIRPLSKKLDSIAPSATTVLNEQAISMKRAGIEVFNFAVGEPDFPTPHHIKKAGMAAIQDNTTRYTPATGILDLKEAICNKLSRDNGLEYTPPEIATTSGGKHALYNLLYVMCDEGDEVIVPAPYWVSYPEMVKLSGATPIILNTGSDTSFKITAELLASKVTHRTKALLLNTPSNPTGMVYTKNELTEIAEIAIELGIFIITDELYEKILYDDHQHESIAGLHPQMKQHALVVNGLSKAYAMTGWRLGYIAGPKDVIDLVVKFQSQTVMHPSAITQHAAITALTSPEDFLPPMIAEFNKRRNYIIKRLESMDGILCSRPGGAFYVFPDVSSYIGSTESDGRKIKCSLDLAMFLLEKYQVISAPGEAFGAEGFLRFSYATDLEIIETGMDRVEAGLASLRN